jgi:hypothetical protein
MLTTVLVTPSQVVALIAVDQSDCDQLVAARSQLPAAGFMERWSAGERAPLADLIRMMLARL